MSILLKKLIILSIISGNNNIYILQNREAILSPYGNLLTLQDLYKPQKTSINFTQNYYSPISQKLEFKRGVLSRDTPVTPYARPPISTDLVTKDRLRDCRNLRQSTAICHILPCPAIFCLPVSTAISAISATSITSAEFCQVYRILLSSAKTMTQSLFCPVYVLTEQLSQ